MLRIHEDSHALYSIWEGAHLSFSTYRSFEVLPYLEWMVISRALAEPSRFLQLHGAALEGEGRGLLVAGHEGSGKTSLTLSLIKEGFRFLTDDVALLHPFSRRLHPFPRPFHLDEASARELSLERLLKGEFCFDYYYSRRKAIYFNPESIFAGSRARATPLKLILFLGERKGGARLRSLPKRKVFFLLLSNSFNPAYLGKEGMAGLLHLLERKPAFKLEGGTLRERTLLIRDLLRQGS